MKVLVVGGSQFNGYALVQELAARGHDVTVVNRGRTDAPFPTAYDDSPPTAPIASSWPRPSATRRSTACTTCVRTTLKTSRR